MEVVYVRIIAQILLQLFSETITKDSKYKNFRTVFENLKQLNIYFTL